MGMKSSVCVRQNHPISDQFFRTNFFVFFIATTSVTPSDVTSVSSVTKATDSNVSASERTLSSRQEAVTSDSFATVGSAKTSETRSSVGTFFEGKNN